MKTITCLLTIGLSLAANATYSAGVSTAFSDDIRSDAEVRDLGDTTNPTRDESEQQRLELEQQSMHIDACRAIYEKDPEQLTMCIKDL